MLCSFEGLWTRVPPLRSRAALRAGLDQFPVALAWGKHLFPFRTEQLSPTAPMVLGLHGPGRGGRRRFFSTPGAVRKGGSSSLGRELRFEGVSGNAPARRLACDERLAWRYQRRSCGRAALRFDERLAWRYQRRSCGRAALRFDERLAWRYQRRS